MAFSLHEELSKDEKPLVSLQKSLYVGVFYMGLLLAMNEFDSWCLCLPDILYIRYVISI